MDGVVAVCALESGAGKCQGLEDEVDCFCGEVLLAGLGFVIELREKVDEAVYVEWECVALSWAVFSSGVLYRGTSG